MLFQKEVIIYVLTVLLVLLGIVINMNYLRIQCGISYLVMIVGTLNNETELERVRL